MADPGFWKGEGAWYLTTTRYLAVAVVDPGFWKGEGAWYRIAGNFRGPYISRIAIKFIFAETHFVDCMIKATPTQVLLAAVSWL